jgi:hypothetical protein
MHTNARAHAVSLAFAQLLADFETRQIIATICCAPSPATAIAVVKELRCKVS